jgi:hypothetical protein
MKFLELLSSILGYVVTFFIGMMAMFAIGLVAKWNGLI